MKMIECDNQCGAKIPEYQYELNDGYVGWYTVTTPVTPIEDPPAWHFCSKRCVVEGMARGLAVLIDWRDANTGRKP